MIDYMNLGQVRVHLDLINKSLILYLKCLWTKRTRVELKFINFKQVHKLLQCPNIAP